MSEEMGGRNSKGLHLELNRPDVFCGLLESRIVYSAFGRVIRIFFALCGKSCARFL